MRLVMLVSSDEARNAVECIAQKEACALAGSRSECTLKRQIEGATDQLDRQKRAVVAARETADALEDQLFRAEADSDQWEGSRNMRSSSKKSKSFLGYPPKRNPEKSEKRIDRCEFPG